MTRIRREELYEQVWSEPMIRLARSFGISDVALAKICRKMLVPVPGRGYWQRRRRGRASAQPPLPSLRAGVPSEVTLDRQRLQRPALGAEASAALVSESDTNNRIHVPDRLRRPHTLITETAAALHQSSVDEWGRLQPRRGARCLDVHVSPDSLPRALRIMDALLKALESRKFAITVSAAPRIEIAIVGETVHIELDEKSKRIDHVLTPSEQESVKRSGMSWARRWDHVPTASLTLTIREYVGRTGRMSWSDGRRRLEEILNDVVARMVVVADLKRTRRQERELRDREQREAEQRQAAIDAQNRREEARGRELLRQAALWRRTERLRVYIDAIEHAAAVQGVQFVPDSEPQRWFAWARGYADQLDPPKAGFPASWTAPVDG